MAKSESDTTHDAASPEPVLVPRAVLDEIREVIIDLYEHMPADNGGYERVVRAVRLCNRHNAILQYHQPRWNRGGRSEPVRVQP